MKTLAALLMLCSVGVALDQPREPRAFFFMAEWCQPCHAALDDFPAWLEASGWSVGDSIRDHIQIVDVDRRADLAEAYGVTQVPSMILIDGGKHSVVPYTGRKSLTDLFEKKTQTVNKTVVANPGLHSHKCNRCGTVWQHVTGAANASHNCPKCGKLQYDVHQSLQSTKTIQVEVPKAAALPRFKTSSGCATGNCPWAR